MLARRHENRLRFSPARRAAATTCRRPRGLVYPVRPVFWLGFIRPLSPSRMDSVASRKRASASQRWARSGLAPDSRFSRPKGQAPDEEAYEQQRLQIQVSCAAMRQCDRGHLTCVLRPSAAAQTRAGW